MADEVHGAPTPPTADQGYEHSDVPIRPLAIFIAGLAISLIVVSGIMAGLFYLFESEAEESDPAPLPLANENPPTPGPLLQVSPRRDLEVLRDREQLLLTTPAWVDRERGVARIPIDNAIELVAERGLPEWPPADGPDTQPGVAARAPQTPAASTRAGSGQQTPVEGGREP